MRKPHPEFRPHKTAARKCLRPLLIAVGLGLSRTRSYRASVSRRPASKAGFLFGLGHQASFEQLLTQGAAGRRETPESDRPRKNCVGRIGRQQANEAALLVTAPLQRLRIGRQSWGTRGIRFICAECGQEGNSPMWARGRGRIQATKIRCKKALASGGESCNIGDANRSNITAPKPASGGFSFSGARFLRHEIS